MFSDDNISNYYRTLFQIINLEHLDLSLTELEGMLPFEKDVYYSLIINDLQEKRKRQEKQ